MKAKFAYETDVNSLTAKVSEKDRKIKYLKEEIDAKI